MRSLVGWTTGSPSWRAFSFTGGGVSVSPRPTGLSGWHTTPTTWATPVRASRQGTEKAGVPKKSARMVISIARTAATGLLIFGVRLAYFVRDQASTRRASEAYSRTSSDPDDVIAQVSDERHQPYLPMTTSTRGRLTTWSIPSNTFVSGVPTLIEYFPLGSGPAGARG